MPSIKLRWLVVAAIATVATVTGLVVTSLSPPQTTEATSASTDGGDDLVTPQLDDRHLDGAPRALDPALDEHHRSLRTPTVGARAHLASLRLLVADAVLGTRDDERLVEVVDQRANWVREAADRLATQAEPAVVVALDGVPTDRVTPAASRWDALEEQRADIAVRLRDTADAAVEVVGAVVSLREASQAYTEAAEDLPVSGDPDELQAAWTDERERLVDYRDAATHAATLPGLAAHADAHVDLTEALLAFTDDAIAAIEDGDLETYNDLLDGMLAHTEDEVAAIEATLEDAVVASVAPLDTTKARTLSLLRALDEVRDVIEWTDADRAADRRSE